MSDYDHLLPVSYKGQEHEFPLRILPLGYTYRFVVKVGGQDLVFEKDEAGELRALLADPAAEPSAKPPEPGLLGAIAEVLEELLKA